MKGFGTHPAKQIALLIWVIFFILHHPQADAQVVVRPSLGLQSIAFLGDPPATNSMSPGIERELPLGGGLSGAQTGFRLQFEAFSQKNDLLRLPISFEYFTLNGKTTFFLSSFQSTRKQRLTFTHEAQVATAGIGLTASFFDIPSLYITGELKGVYFFETDLSSRIFYADNNETVESFTGHPSPEEFRVGGFVKLGTQLAFFDPFLLDFNVGVGTLNMLLKDTDPATQRNLLVADPTRHDPEQTLSYFSLGMTVVWKL